MGVKELVGEKPKGTAWDRVTKENKLDRAYQELLFEEAENDDLCNLGRYEKAVSGLLEEVFVFSGTIEDLENEKGEHYEIIEGGSCSTLGRDRILDESDFDIVEKGIVGIIQAKENSDGTYSGIPVKEKDNYRNISQDEFGKITITRIRTLPDM